MSKLQDPAPGADADSGVKRAAARQVQTFEFQGCRFAYRITGKGPPLMMIQGVGAYGVTDSNPQVEILEQHYTCLTFDNRGIGASQPAGMDLTVTQMAFDAIALLGHVGWASAHILGHSLGGLISLQLALIDKARVRSLTLLCTFARGADATRMTPAILWIGLRLRFAPRRFRRLAFMELVDSAELSGRKLDDLAERLSGVFGHDIADLPAISSRQMKAMGRHDVTARLGELAGIPTLVISAEKDPIARPQSGRAIAAGIPGARYIEISGASHAFPVVDAERCGALVLEHLAKAEQARLPGCP